jgi:hypothetical protein
MARFNFSLGGYQVQVQRQAAVARRALHALDLAESAEAETCLADEEQATRGPGWFDSSWDLVRGLEVREGLPGDARLNEWLAVCLRG